MSVITMHEVSGNDIFDRLKAEGIIHEGDIFSRRRGENVHFENVFDYRNCDDKTLEELHERCSYYLFPVFKTENGGVGWSLNYGSDDLPAIAIGRKYPDEIFDYYQVTENHLDISCKFKGEINVTADGVPYDSLLFKISDKLIHDMGDGTSCVSLYLDTSDKRPAKFYCSNNDIKPVSYRYPDGYSDVVIRDKSKGVTVYRLLEDGTQSKENWSVDSVNDALRNSKEEYRRKLSERDNEAAGPDEPDAADDLEV